MNPDSSQAVGILSGACDSTETSLSYREYSGEEDMRDIMGLIDVSLSEPYSIFTYRYFIHAWPKLTYIASIGEELVGCVICKIDEQKLLRRGYIGMLAVKPAHRKRGIAKKLVKLAMEAIQQHACTEIVLDAEVSNLAAVNLYTSLGFFKDKLLEKYYLNSGDAWRLRYWFPSLDYTKLLYSDI